MLNERGMDLDLSGPLKQFAEHGFARLGPVLTDRGAEQLADRAQALMLGEHPDPGLFFQHDSPTGRYEDLVFNAGWVGPSSAYRKLERMELDPVFRSWIENPLFARLAREQLGETVRLYRSVLWNKAPHRGMAVPWHQDDGRFWGLNQPPFLQVWTALDDAPTEAGCLEVVPGSHHAGLATPEGGTIPPDRFLAMNAEECTVKLPVRRGEAVLVHNHTWHRTGRNRTDRPRRALSLSLLGSEVHCTRKRRAPRQFPRLFDEG